MAKNYKILIPGGKGMLGKAVEELFKNNNINFKIVDLPEFDITKKELIKDEIENYKPTHILNLSAFTKVDLAEVEKEIAFDVNEKGVENLSVFAKELKIKLIHISTDYVFNGRKNGKWEEEDKPDPINIYGLSKLKGEEKVKRLDDFVIVRTSWLFGKGGVNFVRTIFDKLKKGENLKIVNDQKGCPTYTKNLAEAILLLIYKDARGIYHFCQPPPTTWFHFAQKIKELSGFENVKIEPVLSSEYKTKAKRPENSVLSTKKFERDFNFKIPSWEEGLKDYLKEIESGKS